MTLLEYLWIISMGMLAATAFFFMERNTVAPGWKTSVTVAGSSNWYCIHPLHVHERSMGDDWRFTNSI